MANVVGWQGEVAQLTFGIEQEQFVFHRSGALPTEDECTAIWETMLAEGMTHGTRAPQGQLVAVERPTATGPLAMKNDFVSNIFEVAYPPAKRVADFAARYHETQALVEQVLARYQIEIYTGGALCEMPVKLVLRPSDSDPTMARMRTMLHRDMPHRRFSHRYAFGGMCATHIHLNILDDAFYACLPALYSVEYLMPLLYTNSPCFNGQRAHCVRPFMYRDNFDERYHAVGFPEPVPRSVREYAAFIAAAQGFVRDYDFLAPSRHGTVEFRSACSQTTLEDIIEVLALRVAMVVGVYRGYWQARPNNGRPLFWNACRNGHVFLSILDEDYHILRRVQPELPEDLQAPLNGALRRLQHYGARLAA